MPDLSQTMGTAHGSLPAPTSSHLDTASQTQESFATGTDETDLSNDLDTVEDTVANEANMLDPKQRSRKSTLEGPSYPARSRAAKAIPRRLARIELYENGKKFYDGWLKTCQGYAAERMAATYVIDHGQESIQVLGVCQDGQGGTAFVTEEREWFFRNAQGDILCKGGKLWKKRSTQVNLKDVVQDERLDRK
jgi:hypothetical protein